MATLLALFDKHKVAKDTQDDLLHNVLNSMSLMAQIAPTSRSRQKTCLEPMLRRSPWPQPFSPAFVPLFHVNLSPPARPEHHPPT